MVTVPRAQGVFTSSSKSLTVAVVEVFSNAFFLEFFGICRSGK